MRNRVVVLLTQGHVAQLHVVVVVGTKQVLSTRGKGRFTHGLVGRSDIEIAQSLQVAVDNHAYGRVTLHGEGLAAIELPLR